MTPTNSDELSEIQQIFSNNGILPPNSDTLLYGSHLSIVEPVYTKLISDLAQHLKKQINEALKDHQNCTQPKRWKDSDPSKNEPILC